MEFKQLFWIKRWYVCPEFVLTVSPFLWHAEDTMPPSSPSRSLPCHGAPCSSTPQHPDCQMPASHWPAAFLLMATPPVSPGASRSDRPTRGESFKLTPQPPSVNPSELTGFFELRTAVASIKSFNLNHLGASVNPGIPPLSCFPARLAAVWATAL
jgi:hypothetical protein